MGRQRQFDPDEALKSSAELFRRQGFEATSIEELVEYTGVSRAGLYSAFGGKKELYLAALSRQASLITSLFAHRLERSRDPIAELATVLRDVALSAANDECMAGCIVTNSATELSDDVDVKAIVARTFSALEVMFVEALQRAQEQGSLAAERCPQALSRFLVCTIQGMRVVGKIDSRNKTLRDIANVAASVLRQ